MELDTYTRAVLAGLQEEGFAPVASDLAPPGAADFSLPLLGVSRLRCLAIVPRAGALTAAQRRAVGMAWADWTRRFAAREAREENPLRLTLVFLFAGELDAAVQADLRSLAAAAPGWEMAVWVADPTVRFLATFPTASPDEPGRSALMSAGEIIMGRAPRPGRRRFGMGPPDFTPWLTYGLIAACVGLFLLISILERNLAATSDPEVMLNWGAQLAPLVWEGEHWRLLASIFLHWGFLHLAMNVYALYILGWQVEIVFGRWRYLVIYFVAGLAGNVLSLLLLAPYSPSAGASGAIFGLFGAFLYLKVGTPMGQRMRWRPLLEVLGINALISFLPGVDLWGHLGGFVGGAMASALVGLPGVAARPRQAVAGGVLALVVVAVVTPWVPLGPAGIGDFSIGMRARNAGHYTAAAADFRAAVARNPQVGRYYLRLGEAYALAGDPTRAEEAVARAVQLAPEDGSAQEYLARLRRQRP